jgi:AcrR family transcriptional regulator
VTDGNRRRRRAPEDARREILDAATELLATHPAHEVTVAAIMEHTTLSRKSFYVYFRDRSELIAALVQPLRAEADAGLARWSASPDPVDSGRSALLAAARTYRRHGAILRALFWSSAGDPDVEPVRRALADSVIEVALGKIVEAQPDLPDPHATAAALVTMNIHTLLSLAPDAPDATLAHVVDTLSTIWERTLRIDNEA